MPVTYELHDFQPEIKKLLHDFQPEIKKLRNRIIKLFVYFYTQGIDLSEDIEEFRKYDGVYRWLRAAQNEAHERWMETKNLGEFGQTQTKSLVLETDKLTVDFQNFRHAIIERIDSFMSQLPSWFLFTEYADTAALVGEFLTLNRRAQFLGECLKARFGGGGGNPALKAWREGVIDEFDYQVIMHVVDIHELEFAIIQSGWEYIEEELKTALLDEYPCNEVDMYFEVLRENYDNYFKDCVNGQKVTVREIEVVGKLVRDSLWNKTKITAAQLETLKLFHNHSKTNDWWGLIWKACRKNVKRDAALKRKLRELRRKKGDLVDFFVVAAQRERSRNPPHKLKSFKWENGHYYEGTKGGFKLVT